MSSGAVGQTHRPTDKLGGIDSIPRSDPNSIDLDESKDKLRFEVLKGIKLNSNLIIILSGLLLACYSDSYLIVN